MAGIDPLVLAQAQALIADITPEVIDQWVADIQQRRRRGIYPLQGIDDADKDRIAKLAVVDPDRFNELQQRVLEGVPRLERKPLDIRLQWPTRFAAQERWLKELGDVIKANSKPTYSLPTAEHALAEFNKRFVHVIVEPNDWVVDMQSHVRVNTKAWAAYYNDPVLADDGEPQPIGALWLAWRHRNRAEDVICDPQRPSGLIGLNGTGSTKVFNTWRGLQVTPKQGDWSLIHEMIRDGLCGGDETSFEFFLNDLARKLQFPHLHAETATVFIGAHGTGKGTLARILTRIFSPRHCMVTYHSGALTGDFNEHQRDLCVLVADEALFAGDRKSFSILRGVITAPELPIHIKRGARIMVPSHLWVLIFSNDEHVIRTLGDRRRYHTPPMKEWHHNDEPKWKAINQQIDNGGVEAMLFDMLARDVTGHAHRYPPINSVLLGQEVLTRRHSLDAWQHDILQRAYWYESRLGLDRKLHRWPDSISRELAFKSYEQWLRDNRISFHDAKTRNEVYEYLRDPERGPGLHEARLTNAITGELRGSFNNVLTFSPRPRGYTVPDIKMLREAYDTRLKVQTVWDEVVEFPSDDDGVQESHEPPDNDQPDLDYPAIPVKD